MAIKHKNRKGVTYNLVAGKTKTGKPKYYFTQKNKDTPIDAIPDGKEIYESPENAQVFLRNIKIHEVTDAEKEMTEKAILEYSNAAQAIVTKEGGSLVIYLSDAIQGDFNSSLEVFSMFGGAVQQNETMGLITKLANYSKMLRFTLIDKETRLFSAERWCFRGSIDDWVCLKFLKPLPELLEEYTEHLGKESFYELI